MKKTEIKSGKKHTKRIEGKINKGRNVGKKTEKKLKVKLQTNKK